MAHEEMKIVLLGDDGVGKSAIVTQYVTANFFDEYDPCTPVSFRKMVSVDDQTVLLDFIEEDCHEFQAFIDQMTRDGDIFIVVYKICSYESYAAVSGYLRHIYEIHEQQVPLIIFGNKTDLGEEERKVSKEDGEEYARDHMALFLEGSAKTAENIDELFVNVLREGREMKKKYGVVDKNHEGEPPPPPPFVRDVDANRGLSVKRAKG